MSFATLLTGTEAAVIVWHCCCHFMDIFFFICDEFARGEILIEIHIVSIYHLCSDIGIFLSVILQECACSFQVKIISIHYAYVLIYTYQSCKHNIKKKLPEYLLVNEVTCYEIVFPEFTSILTSIPATGKHALVTPIVSYS